MKIVLPGGSGQVGTLLARSFHADGHQVTVLSRAPLDRPWRSETWDGVSLGPWAATFEGADAVVNLVGRSVNCRYTPSNRREILRSRIASTRVVGEAIARCTRPPRVWLQASTATIYAHGFDLAHDEVTGVLGGQEPDAPARWRFSVEVAQAWERTLDEAPVSATRTLKLRSALVLSPDRGGIFDTLLRLVRFGLGGRAGAGRQFVSWIHEHDFTAAIRWLLAHDDLEGVVNLAAPEPLPNAAFMAALRDAWGIAVGLPAPPWLLELGAWVLRTETELVLKSRRVVPRRLLESGFSFVYPEWPQAAAELCRRWRGARGADRAN